MTDIFTEVERVLAEEVDAYLMLFNELTDAKASRTLTAYEDLYLHLCKNFQDCENSLTAWAVKFAKNPAFAMEWGMEALVASARREVFGEMRKSVFGRLTADDETRSHEELMTLTKSWLENETNEASTRVHASTSPMSNLMGEYRRATWARINRNFTMLGMW